MSKKVHVNRQEELATLDRLRQAEVKEQIVLMRADSGFGKTSLLEEFARLLLSQSVVHAHVELQPTFTPLDLMSLLADTLGDTAFSQYRAALSAPGTQGGVQVKNVLQIGGPRIDIKETSRQIPDERLQHLSWSWFADLEVLSCKSPVILIIDQYNLTGEKAAVGPDLQRWIQSSFLPKACKLPRLRVIIAGQHTPNAVSPWKRSCNQVELKPIDDPNAWMDLVHSLHGAVSFEQVHAFCVAMRGHPLNIATYLTMLCAVWPGGD